MHLSFKLIPCAEVILSAAARRVIVTVGGGGGCGGSPIDFSAVAAARVKLGGGVRRRDSLCRLYLWSLILDHY